MMMEGGRPVNRYPNAKWPSSCTSRTANHIRPATGPTRSMKRAQLASEMAKSKSRYLGRTTKSAGSAGEPVTDFLESPVRLPASVPRLGDVRLVRRLPGRGEGGRERGVRVLPASPGHRVLQGPDAQAVVDFVQAVGKAGRDDPRFRRFHPEADVPPGPGDEPLQLRLAKFLAASPILEPSGVGGQEMSRLEEAENQVNREQGGHDESGFHRESRQYRTGLSPDIEWRP